ncbi:MAG: hypothetical protein ACYC6A_16575 [Armatimonadota bacterium]
MEFDKNDEWLLLCWKRLFGEEQAEELMRAWETEQEAARLRPKPEFQTLIPQGYLLFDSNPKISPYQHLRFGKVNRKDARCPCCRRPFFRMLEIDISDPRLGLSGMPFSCLPLYYCFTCRLGLDHFYYRVNADNSVESITKRFTGEGDPFHMTIRWPDESGARLQPLTIEEQAFLAGSYKDMPLSWSVHEEPPPFHQLYGHNDQIGGIPFLDCDWEDYQFFCPLCEQEMPFLATFAAATPDGTPLCGKENDIQLVYAFCPACQVVGTIHTCFM